MKRAPSRRLDVQQVASDMSSAVQRAFVARELAELTRGRLPLPHDEQAEWLVLCMLVDCTSRDVRSAVLHGDLFYLDLHKAVAQVVVEAEPGDENAIALGLAHRLRNASDVVPELAARLCSSPVYTSGELHRAIDRLHELRDVRALALELERLALALRGETQTTDEVRRRLRSIVGED